MVPISGFVSAPLRFPSGNDTRRVGTGATLMPLSSQFCSVWHFCMAPVTNYPQSLKYSCWKTKRTLAIMNIVIVMRDMRLS